MIVAGLTHVFVATLVAYALAAVWGSLTPAIAIVSLIVGTVVAFLRRRKLAEGLSAFALQSWSPGFAGRLEQVLFVFILYYCYRQFAFMLYVADKSIRTISANNFGDLPLHLNYIRTLANGDVFPPVNPSFSLEKLRYPFGVDLYSALWEILGVPTSSHLFLFGMAAAFASLLALRAWGGWLAMGGFFLSGGWAGWEWLATGRFVDHADILAWKNFLLNVFITQRGMLFAVPAGLLLLYAVRRIARGEMELSAEQRRWVGWLWGSLALFHLHAFFVVSLFAPFILFIYRGWTGLRAQLSCVLWALPAGTFFTLYSTEFFKKAGITHWRLGWMTPANGAIGFFIYNFGPFLILAVTVLAYLFFARRREPASHVSAERGLLREALIYGGFFLLFLNLMLAPWDWDNIKVLLWPYLGLLAISNEVLRSWLMLNTPAGSQSGYASIGQVALAFVLFFSGTAAILRVSQTTASAVTLFTLSDVANAAGAVQATPIAAVFAAAPTHDHALAWLGRRRALGYEGHLWSHGINSQSARADLDILMRGQDGWREAAQRLHVTHIYWGPVERQQFGAPPAGPAPAAVSSGVTPGMTQGPAWQSTLRNISPVADYEVYSLQKE